MRTEIRQPRVCPACGMDHDERMPLPLREIADRMADLSSRLLKIDEAIEKTAP